jgi:membrane-associated protease RseP (regulator of RpoE activity)
MLLSLILAVAVHSIDAPSLKALAEADSRLVVIGRKLARGGAGLCSGTVSNPGWTIEDAEQFAPASRREVRAALGLGVFPTVVRVEPGGAAARAGVKAGDEILAVAGQALAEAASRSSRSRQEGIEEAMARGATDVTVERASRPMTVHIAPEPGCPSEFLIGRSRGLRAASSNGTRVTISPEIIEFAASDDELAFVMAHEFAHNILGHNRGTPATRVSGEDRSGARSRDREHEADRWALYLVARAGYDPSVAPGFWRRWGPRTGFGILSDGSHPDWRDRAARAEAEIARIKVQLVTGQVPVP